MSSKLDSKVTSTVPEILEHDETSGPLQSSNSPRRNFLKFFGLRLVGSTGLLASNQAWAGVWKKLGTTNSGGGLKWRKLAPVTTNTFVDSQIACGYFHSVTLRSDGLISACGYNGVGQLGDGTTTSRSTYVQRV